MNGQWAASWQIHQALKWAFIEHLSIGPITTGRERKTQLSRGRWAPFPEGKVRHWDALQSAPQGSAAAASTSEAGGPDYSYAHNDECTAVEGQGERWSFPVACAPSWCMVYRADRKVGTPFWSWWLVCPPTSTPRDQPKEWLLIVTSSDSGVQSMLTQDRRYKIKTWKAQLKGS